jgi:hypothetical protein
MREAKIQMINLEDPQNAGKLFDGYNLLVDDSGRPIGAISLDERGLVAQVTKVYCLAVDLDKLDRRRTQPASRSRRAQRPPRQHAHLEVPRRAGRVGRQAGAQGWRAVARPRH